MRCLHSQAKTKVFDRAEELKIDTNPECDEVDVFTEQL